MNDLVLRSLYTQFSFDHIFEETHKLYLSSFEEKRGSLKKLEKTILLVRYLKNYFKNNDINNVHWSLNPYRLSLRLTVKHLKNTIVGIENIRTLDEYFNLLQKMNILILVSEKGKYSFNKKNEEDNRCYEYVFIKKNADDFLLYAKEKIEKICAEPRKYRNKIKEAKWLLENVFTMNLKKSYNEIISANNDNLNKMMENPEKKKQIEELCKKLAFRSDFNTLDSCGLNEYEIIYLLKKIYPQLGHYIKKCEEIESRLGRGYRFGPNITLNKIQHKKRGEYTAIKKIGIRCYDEACHTKNEENTFEKKLSRISFWEKKTNTKEDMQKRDEYLRKTLGGTEFEHYDVKSSVPTVTRLVLFGEWEEKDGYIDLIEKYGLQITRDDFKTVYLSSFFTPSAEEMKNHLYYQFSKKCDPCLFFSYHGSKRVKTKPNEIAESFNNLAKGNWHAAGATRTKSDFNKFAKIFQLSANYLIIESEIEKLKNIIEKSFDVIAENRLPGTEVFFHESCIYLDVIDKLLTMGINVAQVYDCFYFKKGEMPENMKEIIKECAMNYYNTWIVPKKDFFTRNISECKMKKKLEEFEQIAKSLNLSYIDLFGPLIDNGVMKLRDRCGEWQPITLFAQEKYL